MPRESITLHHLKPQEKGGRAKHRTPLCRPCHKQLHAVFSNAKLAKSLDQDRAAEDRTPELQTFLEMDPQAEARPELSHGPVARSHPDRTAVGIAPQNSITNMRRRIKKAVPGKDGFEWGW